MREHLRRYVGELKAGQVSEPESIRHWIAAKRWARIALLAIAALYEWRSGVNLFNGLGRFIPFLVYNDIGTFIVLTYVYVPFAVLVLYASLERFDFTQITAAQDLGARPSQAFRHVLLPQVRPGLITAAIFVFIPILGEFLTPSMVGGAGGLLIANLVANFFKNALIPEGAAVGFMIAAFVLVLLIVFRRYLRVEDVYARG